MANSSPHTDPAANLSLSMLRRRLLSADPDDIILPPAAPDHRGAVEFDHGSRHDEGDAAGQGPIAYDEVEALLQRYQAEKSRSTATTATTESDIRLPPLTGSGTPRRPDPRRSNGSMHGEVLRQGGRAAPPAPPGEVEQLREENAELKAIVAELRHYLEQNDPTAWEERLKQAEEVVAERDELIVAQKQAIEEFQDRLRTHRFVPNDDELAQMADEVEKERCQLAQLRKELEDAKAQLAEDEDGLMKQMREMEVSMAKERADLARQRSDLQRLQAEIKHEMEILERGDAGVKERLQQFQRRQTDSVRLNGVGRVTPPPGTLPTPVAPPAAPPPPARPKESGVFKRLFGQGE